MIRIINLSSLHTLASITEGINAFATLCDTYSKGCCFYCPGIFTKFSNKMWVMYIYYQNLDSVINPYKLGQINTQQFLDKMLKIFNFLKDKHLIVTHYDKKGINENKHQYLSTKNVDTLDQQHYILALLEDAWSKIISFSENDFLKFNFINNSSSENPTYLISNTNELNVHKILSNFKSEFPDVKWNQNIDLSVQENEQDEPIEIAPNLFLYLSYKAHTFKINQQNTHLQTSTPALLERLIIKLEKDLSEIEIISQHDNDLKQAKQLGISDKNIHKANDFFSSSLKTELQSMRVLKT